MAMAFKMHQKTLITMVFGMQLIAWELKVFKELQDLLDLKGLQVMMVRQEYKGQKDHKGLPDQLDLLELKE